MRNGRIRRARKSNYSEDLIEEVTYGDKEKKSRRN